MAEDPVEYQYTFASENDRSPWDTLTRLAGEVGWELNEPEPGVVEAVPSSRPLVSAVTQGKITASEPVPSPTRHGVSRQEYMAEICASAGVEFKGPEL